MDALFTLANKKIMAERLERNSSKSGNYQRSESDTNSGFIHEQGKFYIRTKLENKFFFTVIK